MITYTYIPGSIEQAQAAWLEFEPRTTEMSSRPPIQFIPAAGGCFVVANVRPKRARWIDMLLGQVHGQELERPCRQMLEAFSAFCLELGARATNPHSEVGTQHSLRSLSSNDI